jgi:hypothetical protein
MSNFDSAKDYYEILGADSQASQRDIDRLYKQQASRHHPDRGGSEEEMKKLNEAYGVLKNADVRQSYDQARSGPPQSKFVPANAPAASDVGVFGHALSALLCLLVGLFLLVLVRAQWIWFLWPLAILATFVIAFGILMARGAIMNANPSLPLLRRHGTLLEILFWIVIAGAAYGLYLLLTGM